MFMVWAARLPTNMCHKMSKDWDSLLGIAINNENAMNNDNEKCTCRSGVDEVDVECVIFRENMIYANGLV